MDCRSRCWIAGAIAGLLVFLAAGVLGGAGLLAGLVLGAITAALLGALLVWGLCEGAGTAEENAALMLQDWTPEPFEPARRIVAPGGGVVSTEPLAEAGVLADGSARESVTLTPPQGSQVAEAIVRGEPVPPAPAPAEADERRATPDLAAASAAMAGLHGGMGIPPLAMAEPPRAPAPDAPTGPAAAAAPTAPAHAATPAGDTDAPAPGPARGQVALTSASASTAPGPEVDAPAAEPPYPAETLTDDPLSGMAAEVPPPVLPGSGGEALALDASGAADPSADAEAGADPDAPEGGIVPLAEAAAAPRTPSDPTIERVATITDAGDDLKRLKGVGPMLETWLHGQGITSFAQIAAWDDADIARYAGMMGRQGHRIREEDWVGQARSLAAHGAAGDERPAGAAGDGSPAGAAGDERPTAGGAA